MVVLYINTYLLKYILTYFVLTYVITSRGVDRFLNPRGGAANSVRGKICPPWLTGLPNWQKGK